MKNLILKTLLFVFSLFLFFSFQKTEEQNFGNYNPDSLDEIIVKKEANGLLFFDVEKMKGISGFTKDKIYTNFKHLFDFGEHNTIEYSFSQEINRRKEGKSIIHFYDLYHKGFLLKKKAVFFKEKNNVIVEGFTPKVDLDIDTTIGLGKEEIIEIAKTIVPAEKYTWELGEDASNFMPSPSLEIVNIENEHYLAYNMNISTWKPYNDIFFISLKASNGDLLIKKSTHKHCGLGFASSNCSTEVENSKDVQIIYYQGSEMEALDPIPDNSYTNTSPLSSGTRTVRLKECEGESRLFQDGDGQRKIELFDFDANPPGGGGYSWDIEEDCVANTFYWGGERIWDFFSLNYNYTFEGLYLGLDNNNNTASSNGDVMGGSNSSNWVINLGRGNTPNTKPKTTIDVIGHEFVHGIDEYNSNLNSSSSADFMEDGIIEEGFCDIFGVVIESEYKAIDWNVGGDFSTTDFRRFDDPHLSIPTQPKFYKGDNWAEANSVSQEVFIHQNNGVFNHWFYLLTNGGTGINEVGYEFVVNPIGIDAATDIAYQTLVEEIGIPIYENKDFKDLVQATLSVTMDDFGVCSFEHEQASIAWRTVGLLDCKDLSLETSITENTNGTSTLFVNVINGSGCYSYEWSQNGIVIPGELGADYEVPSELVEDYAVMVSDEFAECRDEIPFIRTSIDEEISIDKIDISSFPNPAYDKLNVIITSEELLTDEINISFHNIQGQQVLTNIVSNLRNGEQKISFDISDIPSGLYFIFVSTDKFKSTQKVIVQ